jgi:ketosteroid isomerase-like protein
MPLSPHDDALTSATRAVIERFNAAFNRHDVSAIMALMTDDCVFENTYPPPDGERYEGQQAVRAFWEKFFHSSPTAHFDFEGPLALPVDGPGWKVGPYSRRRHFSRQGWESG